MRLLRLEDFSLVEVVGKNIPRYAVLSHTWGPDQEEVTYKEIVKGTGKSKAGYAKIQFCGKQAAKDNLQYIWVDTCCINKSSSAELQEAINSMFYWYQKADKCYVYLSDVSVSSSIESDLSSQQKWMPTFQDSRWFTRGWTLQELLAPTSIEFFSAEGEHLGNRISLLQEIHDVTGISLQALQGNHLSHFSVNERMSWANGRETKREEDAAYSLLGIFDIHIPLIYGEGRKKALKRLHREIRESLKDSSPTRPPAAFSEHENAPKREKGPSTSDPAIEKGTDIRDDAEGLGRNMQMIDLESRVKVLLGENRQLQEAKIRAEELLHNATYQKEEGFEARDRAEIERLQHELDAAKEQNRAFQRQILAPKPGDSFLTVRDEDYFESACQQLCFSVQQWVLRFSKMSDTRPCRLTAEIQDEKLVDRLDNAILDGSDVDVLLADRVKRRDVFMSIVTTMIWEYVFTRFLFGMDREQRQKLKSLEKTLRETAPAHAVAQWRAITLTFLAKRGAFQEQCDQDTKALVHAIYFNLSTLLPPPSAHAAQLQESLRYMLQQAISLSIEMRTQRAEYTMLPPLQPEYDANGDLVKKVLFNASLMNERSGETGSNEKLEQEGAVVRIVLFPLVVKQGDDYGEGMEQIVVCPAQVLAAKPNRFSPKIEIYT